MSGLDEYLPKPVTLTLNGKTVIFDPVTARWQSQKQSSEQYKRL